MKPENTNFRNQQGKKVLPIPYIALSNNWQFVLTFLEKRGNPEWISEDILDLSNNQDVTDLRNLIHAKDDLYLGGNMSISTLGKLTKVDGKLHIIDIDITSLGNLTEVGGDFYIRNTKITSLDNLTKVGGNLTIINSPITSLGKLKFVGGNLKIQEAEGVFSEHQIRQVIEVRGNIL